MKEIKMGFRKRYYDFLNFFVRRIMAVGFIAAGTVIGISGVHYLFPGATVLVDGRPSDDPVMRLFAALMPLIMVVLGILLYRVSPYYPKDTLK